MVAAMKLHALVFSLAAMVLPAVGGRLSAADEKPDPKVEIFSAGTPDSTFYIRRSTLDAIKLPEAKKMASVTVTHAATGYFEKDPKSDNWVFVATQEVPHKAGLKFGWVMWVQTTAVDCTVAESFTLPKSGNWTSFDADNTKISEDGKTATTTERTPVWDALWHAWTMEAGDPDGDHVFSLSVEGQEPLKLPFKIVKKATP